jgi:DNA-binding PadR family transcriptional regulator
VDSEVGHAHKYYELTDIGRATLKAMSEAWNDFNEAFDRLISQS